MGKNTDNLIAQNNKALKNRKVRMAYTLNNSQPVLCTIVSDQPFFYIDEEIQGDDDCLFADDFSHDIDMGLDIDGIDDPSLIHELTQMKNKMDAYETMSKRHDKFESRHDILTCFRTQGAETFEESVDIDGTSEVENSLSDILNILGKSKTAEFYLNYAKENDLKIIHSSNTQKIYLDAENKKILLSANLTTTDGAILLARELRRFWKHEQNAMINPLDFDPDDAVLVYRAQQADLDGAIMRVGWELRLANEYDVWNRLENSFYADLARAFAREALSDFRTLNNGKAQAVMFETWFLSTRCNAADKKLINMMLSDYKDYVQSEEAQNTPFDILCRLGEQPTGKNYLSHYANMIVEDGLFTDVRDRSNANFLWFIKFERNFGEAEKIAEQQLQTIDVSKKSGDSDLIKNKYIEDTHNEKIHAFPCRIQHGNNARAELSADKSTQGGNNVIFASFGSCGSNYGQS